MSDIPDSKYITDYPVAIAVDLIDVLLDIIFYHRSLEFGTLIGIKAHIIGILIK